MALEVTSVVCGVGTEADSDELDVEWDTADGDDCCGLVGISGTGSAFTGGDELVSGRESWGVDVGSGTGERVSPAGCVSVFVLTRPASGDGSAGESRVCVVKGASMTVSAGVDDVGSDSAFWGGAWAGN